MKKACIVLLIAITFSGSIFAADQIAKEDTTPPAPEGPLTIDQLQAYNSLPLANTQPPQTATSPQAVTSPQAPTTPPPATTIETPGETQ